MQLLGKNYLGGSMQEKRNDGTDPAGADGTVMNAEGLDALCRAVEAGGGRKLPPVLARPLQVLKNNRKGIAVAASVLLIGAAMALNWTLYRDGGKKLPTDIGQTASAENPGTALADVTAVQGDADGAEDGISDYFAVSQINRQRARDEAIEVLQNVADGAANLTDVREDALAEIAKIAADIENEAAIESLVKGKGFDACVAVISGDSANVIVKSAALLPNEVTQIQEIVYETAGILPVNVKIIEK